ncbi:MAG: YqgE/AlgH family protein [Hymenobacteraceae bacterium]|mgnify:CR=1 FL=1|nr:YqgE/AlgH family protein [Hymenobacteraceae bacterium]MDX5394912.1 YqgE/AlgH family protein [Hymenobacteraceae bacterium]MDX5442394.1 YqgE/AlgH family protein [Hymenobacteraceae bacterium]MDX5510947.1 YqgE/AlgH family protein [Hymenobacteraceae bacterium]
MQKIQNGSILISEPFLGDENFERSVVLVCSHSAEGSFGLVLNRLSNLMLSDVLPVDEAVFDKELGIGGPMEHNTLHYLHQLSDLPESIQLSEQVFWGGDFNELQDRIAEGQIAEEKIRFFLGYSGWDAGQLEEEIEKNVWIINNQAIDKFFNLSPENLWREILKRMGGKYKMLSNYPIDPSLN